MTDGKKYRKSTARGVFSWLFIVTGCLLLAAGAGLVLYNEGVQLRSEEASRENLQVIADTLIGDDDVYSDTDPKVLAAVLSGSGVSEDKIRSIVEKLEADESSRTYLPDGGVGINELGEVSYPDYVINPDAVMPTARAGGLDYAGVLCIPSYGLTLPIVSECTEDNLKISPCVYSGTVYRDGFVIAGHNYRKHFSTIKNISAGEPVYFVDMQGNTFRYRVAGIEQIAPEDKERMLDDSWAMTLFTCTTGGQSRVAIRCERDDEASLQ